LFTGFGIAGSLLGSRVSSLVPQHALQRVFSALLVLVGAGILWTHWR
jgi:uncharacterized membrane protein YfcA